MTQIEQQILTDISEALSAEGITLYEDRGEFGRIAFLVCRDTTVAREIVDDTPALCEVRGSSLIITVQHPDREA